MAQFSRRHFLQGAGVGALSAALGVKLTFEVTPSRAQGSAPTPAYYSTAMGDFTVSVIRDGVGSAALDVLAANAEAEEVNELLAANNFPTGDQPSNFKILMVNTGSDLVLFDTGFGTTNPNGGQLIPTLEMMGIAPGDITTVAITHWHPDHLNGASINGSPAFPNARYLISQVEYDLLQSDSANQGFQNALATLQPIVDAGLLEFYNDGDEILSGIQAVAMPGHTLGHHGFLISSGGMGLLNTVDAIVHPVISTQRPDWYFGFDADPDQAVETRRAGLERVASEGLMMFGYHFPFPGIGVVAATGEENAYRFTPLSY